jgi:3-methyladenine DNA glycosylase AlkD
LQRKHLISCKMKNIIETVRNQLRENIDIKIQGNSQRFFKEKIDYYGVKVPVVNKISKECFREIKTFEKKEIFGLIETLWQSGILEESFVACNWTYALRKNFRPEDFKTFNKWIDLYVHNWASCDTLCNHSVGEFIQMYPNFLVELKKFTQSENRWIRRASAVTLIIPARKGLFLNNIFEIANQLLTDDDDLVQKGYGWMLKAASQAHQTEVFDYVMKNKTIMPRTALRYAIEKMPKDMRVLAMKK